MQRNTKKCKKRKLWWRTRSLLRIKDRISKTEIKRMKKSRIIRQREKLSPMGILMGKREEPLIYTF
jgi:hypothetical protein